MSYLIFKKKKKIMVFFFFKFNVFIWTYLSKYIEWYEQSKVGDICQWYGCIKGEKIWGE